MIDTPSPSEPRLRLLYIHPGNAPPDADARRNASSYLARHFDGDLVTISWDDQSTYDANRSTYESAMGGFGYHPSLSAEMPPLIQMFWQFLWYILRSLKLIHETGPYDLIVAYGPFKTGWAGLIVKMFTGTPLVIQMTMNPYRSMGFHQTRLAGFKQWLVKRTMPLLMRQTDHLHLMYEEQLSTFPKFDYPPASAFPDFVPNSLVTPNETGGDYILFLGFPWRLKGVDILIQAFNNISADYPGTKLKIVGHCPDRAPFERLVAGNERIELLKAVNHGEAMALMTHCAFFVLPSRTEGMPRVIQEAWAAKKAVVASAVDGIPYYVDDGVNGLLFPSEDIDTLADRLRALLDDPNRAAAMGQAGFELVNAKYREEHYAQSFADMAYRTIGRAPVQAVETVAAPLPVGAAAPVPVPVAAQARKPRILYIHPGDTPPHEDPRRNALHFLGSQLSGDLVTISWDSRADYKARKEQYAKALGGFGYHPSLSTTMPGVARMIWQAAFYTLKGLSLSFKGGRYDAIVAYGPFKTGWAGLLVKALTGAPLIVEMPVNPYRSLQYHDGHLVQFKAWLLRKTMPLLMAQTDHLRLLYASQTDEFPPMKLPPQSAFAEFVASSLVPDSAGTDDFILFLGFPWRLKGVDILIQAFNSLAPDFPDTTLKIVGHCPDRTPFEALANGNQRIEFHPGIPHQEAMQLVSRCRFLTLPSRTEGMGRVMLEAWAARKAVVASNVDGIPHYVEHERTGLLFESENIEALAASMRRLLENPDEASRMGASGYDVVHERYSEHNYAEAFEKMVRRTIADSTGKAGKKAKLKKA